jgi:hypothetical protein
MIKISLPNVSVGKDVKAHPYPFQIAYQAREFIQGAIFYASIADISSGNYFRQTNSMEGLREQFITGGGELSTWDGGWQILGRYKDIFKITVFQNVLVAINSHWDWYIRNLGKFVSFARQYLSGPALGRREENDLSRIGFSPILKQMTILEKSCGIKFGLSSDILEDLKEMTLVRNLALHNRWEVDQKYLDNTSNKKHRNVGELRLFDSSELGLWHESLVKLINSTWESIATIYLNVPPFPQK